MLRQIMFAGVANDENNNGIFVEICSDAKCRGEIRSRRTAAKNSFQASELARQLKRFAIRNVDDFVDVLDVYVRRHNLLPDSFNQVRSGFHDLSGLFESLEDRTVGIRADNPDRRVCFLQKTAGARDRSAGAESGNEVGDLAVSLPPDFGTGGAIV